jgi:hypothetical protein
MLYLSHYDNSPTYTDLKDHHQGDLSLLSEVEQQKFIQCQCNSYQNSTKILPTLQTMIDSPAFCAYITLSGLH